MTFIIKHKNMAVTRRGNRIDLTGKDASAFARAVLPSMRNKPEPQKKEYTVKCQFNTARAGRGGSISGSSGGGEVDITVDGPFDKANTTDPELIQMCTGMLQANPKIKGTIISLNIVEIVDKV